MARKNDKVSMPVSTAGITRYFEGYNTRFSLQPGHVIVLVIIIVALIILLHQYGDVMLGIR